MDFTTENTREQVAELLKRASGNLRNDDWTDTTLIEKALALMRYAKNRGATGDEEIARFRPFPFLQKRRDSIA